MLTNLDRMKGEDYFSTSQTLSISQMSLSLSIYIMYVCMYIASSIRVTDRPHIWMTYTRLNLGWFSDHFDEQVVVAMYVKYQRVIDLAVPRWPVGSNLWGGQSYIYVTFV